MISSTVSREIKNDQGSTSNSLNRATAWSSCTSVISVFRPSFMIRFRAVSPNTENHWKVNTDGTSITPNTNWRMVRPRLILAINMDMNGAQAMVQPKMNSVQLQIQSLQVKACRLKVRSTIPLR